MSRPFTTYLFTLFFVLNLQAIRAQELTDSLAEELVPVAADSISSIDADVSVFDAEIAAADSVIHTLTADSVIHTLTIDSVSIPQMPDPKQWVPDPKKAMWLAIAIPGGGQIYNRKYWKLPIIYGGFVGCFYALTWNGAMYRDYSQAYLDIMDSDPNTASYKDFVPPSYDIDSNLDYFKGVFKRRKDMYRRYRDLSIFCLIGVYLISVVDAYIDAEMSTFDISRDLSLKIRPAVINDSRALNPMISRNTSYGLQCSFNF